MTKQVKLLGITQLCSKTGCTVIDLTSCSVSGGQNSKSTNRAELKRMHCWLASFNFFLIENIISNFFKMISKLSC